MKLDTENGNGNGGGDGLKFVLSEDPRAKTRIRVIGVGGGGSNAVARMMSKGLKGVDFYVINTDVQVLESSPVPNRLVIGKRITNGLGAGSDPAVGREAALEDTERIVEIIEGADMVFVAVGLGGGTGTGAAPVIASLAKELNALTVAIVTKPFAFEGSQRAKTADQGLAELANTVDAVITVPNDKLLDLVPPGSSLTDAFAVADDVLLQAVQGISDIICTPGLINRDFSDVRATMLNMGHAMMGTATAKGANAALEAARKAINNPLLEDAGIAGARAILINVTASPGIAIHDINEACRMIMESAGNHEARVSFGLVADPQMGEEVKVTVIATGFRKAELPQPVYERVVVADRAERHPPLKAAAAAAGAGFGPPVPVVHEEPVGPALGLGAAPPMSAAVATDLPPASPWSTSGEHASSEDLEVPAFLRRGRSL